VRLSVAERSLELLVDAAELERRRALWVPPAKPVRGWDRIIHDQVLQADEGCDLGVMRPGG
jgi:dihydroxy-acid dehydratase